MGLEDASGPHPSLLLHPSEDAFLHSANNTSWDPTGAGTFCSISVMGKG